MQLLQIPKSYSDQVSQSCNALHVEDSSKIDQEVGLIMDSSWFENENFQSNALKTCFRSFGLVMLHNFGRKFYGCRHWKPGSDEHCKSFKWLDGMPCKHGAETTPIVIMKFTRLKAEAAMAKNNEMEARAMVANALHRERVAKRSAKKARVSQH
ncbi:hypothetical protein SO802_017540 [Lithocarpus litseifolius]|uniref:Zinc finger GRF-type domain-containing protein n=1 Tax=Lithocarpus litseifolius TaxID=425828 RepID=A0AAW2CKL1_9ROSI